MHKLTTFVGDTEYFFKFIAYKDPAELDVHTAIMRLPERLDEVGEWHESPLLPADHERLIWENQAAWQPIPTAAEVSMNAAKFWAQSLKDTAKEKAIY